jgi:large subunit ribosomal protein L11
LEKAAKNSKLEKVGEISLDQVKQIAELKMPDLNASDLPGAMKMIKGTARSMGIKIKE